MASRHAGFAMVTCVTEGLINNLIEAAFVNYPQNRSFRLPNPLVVNGSTITIHGEGRLQPPVVRLAGGQVEMLVRAEVEARMDGASANPLDILVELSCPSIVNLLVFVQGGQMQVGIDASSLTIPNITLRVVDGSLPSAYGQALHLPNIAAAIQAAIRALPVSMLQTTVDGFPLTATIAPRQMPCGASLFDLPEIFHATFSISRVVPVVLEGVLAIGVDVAGITNGNPGALRSLFGDARPVWVRTDGPEGTIDFTQHTFRGRGNLVTSVNPDAFAGILSGPISAASHHAFVDCHVALDGLGMSASTFSPNLQPQYRIDGLRMAIGARYYRSTARDAQSRLIPAGDGTPVQVSVPFAVHRQTWDGDTAFLSRRGGDSWFIKVYEPDIDLPWWIDVGLVLLGIILPVFALPVIVLLDGIIPSILGNVANQLMRNTQAGINGAWREFDLGATSHRMTLPRLPATPASANDIWYAMDGEGIDVYSTVTLASQPDRSRDRNIIVTIDGTVVKDGAKWERAAIFTDPIAIAVRPKPGSVDPLDRNVMVRWEVRRTDTGAVVLTQDLPLRKLSVALGSGPVGGPDPRKVVIDRSDPEISVLPGFEIYVRVYRPLLGRSKEIGAAKLTLTISDRLDRTHTYVWWKGWAVGSPKESVLHRTATPGRCRMVERAPLRTQYQYLDELPFPIEEIAEHRNDEELQSRHLKVCDYCFFGGPTRTQLLIGG